MKNNEVITKVVFRKFRDGEIIALFPEVTDSHNYTVMSYMHIGQHSGADPRIVRDTKLATPEEYMPLYNELTNYCGYVLRVGKKMKVRFNY